MGAPEDCDDCDGDDIDVRDGGDECDGDGGGGDTMADTANSRTSRHGMPSPTLPSPGSKPIGSTAIKLETT